MIVLVRVEPVNASGNDEALGDGIVECVAERMVGEVYMLFEDSSSGPRQESLSRQAAPTPPASKNRALSTAMDFLPRL